MAVIGIMSAMHEELAAVLAAMPDEQGVRVAGRDFWVGHWHGHDVVVVLSRIGKVAAATTATVLLERFKVDTLVFTGAAGGLAADAQVGEQVGDGAPLGVAGPSRPTVTLELRREGEPVNPLLFAR